MNSSDRDAQIRAKAYALWEDEGRPEGREAEHWRRASDLVDGVAPEPEDVPIAEAADVRSLSVGDDADQTRGHADRPTGVGGEEITPSGDLQQQRS